MSQPPRRAKRTLNIVTALYVVIGFCVAVPAAATGNRLNAFLGFLIISGALAAAAVIAPVLRIVARIAAMDDSLRDVRHRLRRIESALDGANEPAKPAAAPKMIDLARFGRGDPSVLTAATLERDVFPRLVKTMDEAPPAGGDQNRDHEPSEAPPAVPAAGNGQRQAAAAERGPRSLDLLGQWREGLTKGDLAACRAVFSAIVDTVDSPTLAALEAQLEALADEVESDLRRQFAEYVRDRDLPALADLGGQILRLLPDRPIADEFRRLQPALLRRLDGEARLPDDIAASSASGIPLVDRRAGC